MTNTSFPDIRNKRILVTGGASGIGLGIAKEFGREGGKIFLVDISPENLETATMELVNAGVEVRSALASVSDTKSVEQAFQDCDKKLGGIDVLINNAGIPGVTPSTELTDEEWQRMIDINLTGMFKCARAAGQRMCAQGHGVIINLASLYGIAAAPERLGYCVTKTGAVTITKTLAIEWASKGVRVNALAPGYIKTALVNHLLETGAYDIESIEKRTPMGRLGTVQEIADSAIFLASDRARFITGQVLVIDGGWSAYGYL